MVKQLLIYHGGDLASAESRFGRHRWLDLSTGVNPFGYPVPRLPKNAWARLPDRALVTELCATAAEAYGLRDPACVVAGPGSQALIQLIPRLVAPGRVLIATPTYGEYAAAWSAAGHQVEEVAAAPPVDLGNADTLVLANPNNPDGQRYAKPRLRDWWRHLAARGGRLVIDEAFADLDPELSLAAEAHRPGLIVLRSFGKFFGLAGVRLGFALAAPDFSAHLATALGPWAVSGPAAQLGIRALQDRAWIAATRLRLGEAAAALDRLLAEAGLAVKGGTDLFRLVEDGCAGALFEQLGRRGILVRDFPEHPRWLRIGLPGNAAASRRLARALAASWNSARRDLARGAESA